MHHQTVAAAAAAAVGFPGWALLLLELWCKLVWCHMLMLQLAQIW
jgi:hypothetical protein